MLRNSFDLCLNVLFEIYPFINGQDMSKFIEVKIRQQTENRFINAILLKPVDGLGRRCESEGQRSL